MPAAFDGKERKKTGNFLHDAIRWVNRGGTDSLLPWQFPPYFHPTKGGRWGLHRFFPKFDFQIKQIVPVH